MPALPWPFHPNERRTVLIMPNPESSGLKKHGVSRLRRGLVCTRCCFHLFVPPRQLPSRVNEPCYGNPSRATLAICQCSGRHQKINQRTCGRKRLREAVEKTTDVFDSFTGTLGNQGAVRMPPLECCDPEFDYTREQVLNG